MISIPSIALAALVAIAPPPAPASPTTAAPPTAPPAAPTTVFVQMTTSQGPFILELDQARAPITVENFLEYVRSGHYDGTVFHRVIPTFMIQGGGFDTEKRQKRTGAPIRNEGDNGLSNRRGTIAMARTNDPNSATAQFYINVVDNPALDTQPGRPGYAVFGKVVRGMEVVDRIRVVPTGTSMATTPQGNAPMQNWPTETVEIVKAEILPELPAETPKAPATPAAPPTPSSP
jgi:cyclophilin family peptidyl-prolyl cis-trans isomerase